MQTDITEITYIPILHDEKYFVAHVESCIYKSIAKTYVTPQL